LAEDRRMCGSDFAAKIRRGRDVQKCRRKSGLLTQRTGDKMRAPPGPANGVDGAEVARRP
jgi:hypothetical protein